MIQSSQETQGRYCLSKDAIKYYYDHAYDFVCDIILKPVWDKYQPTWQQKDLLDAISKYDKVGIESGHGPGKSCALSWCIIWFLSTRTAPCRVPCTAPTGRQLKTVLWPEISRWLGMSLMRDELLWMATEIRHKIQPKERFGEWLKSDKSDNMQGKHAEHMLWIVDEWFGITDPMIFEVIEGSMTGDDNKLIGAGNHTVVTGYAHDCFNRNKALWTAPFGKLLRFNAEESPIANKAHIKQMELKWGRSHDVYRVRVLGLPPLGNPDAFLKIVDIEAAIARELELAGKIELGVDCARFGDDLTIISSRFGLKFFPLIKCEWTDEVKIYEMVIKCVRDMRGQFEYNERIRIKIDNTGGYGAGAYDLLKRNTTDNIEVIGMNFGSGATDESANTITAMWTEFRNALPKMELPDDADLVGELSSRRFKFVAKGGRDLSCVESKSEFKRRLTHSPDRSDAVMLCITEKSIRRKVWDFYAPDHTAQIKINWDKMSPNTTPLISLWTEDDLKTSALVCLWQSDRGRLIVVGEYEFNNPQPEIVLPKLIARVKEISGYTVKDLSRFQVFANDIFFKDKIGDMQSAYRRHKQHIRENHDYDETGSILFVGRLILNNNILIDESLGGLPDQMGEWPIDAGIADDKFGYCRALCTIVSTLNEIGKVKPVVKTHTPYGKESPEFFKTSRKLASEGRYSDISRGTETAPSKDDWMVM